VETTGEKEFVKYRVSSWRTLQKTVGFVPTMGALHAGHLDLVKRARKECDFVVVSIFVNPLQFNNQNDLQKYPRDLKADQELLGKENVDVIYAPSVSDFYGSTPTLTLDFGAIENVLEGEMRPGHFSGVGIVVARLFHIVQPHKAYFGAKDLQQVAVIKNLIDCLSFDIELVRCPTRREESGLAMSSRNIRLSGEGKDVAAQLNLALEIGLKHVSDLGIEKSKKMALNYLTHFPELKVEYLEWVEADTMKILENFDPKVDSALCIAAWLEGVRLIDNVILEL